MKIGLITHYMPPHNGGIERVADLLFAAYLQRGFDVQWVASREPVDAPRRDGNRIRVPCWNGLERWCQVPLPLWGPRAWGEVARLARWADVLHVHDCLYPGSLLGILSGRCFGTPVLLSQHVGLRSFGSPLLTVLARMAYQTLGRWVLRRASRLVFVTPSAESYMTALLGDGARRGCSIRNGVDTARFRPPTSEERQAARARLEVPATQVVLFVGRLVEQKGVDLLVEVIRRVPTAHYLVVGDGPLAAMIPQGPNTTWHRSVAPERMHECYQASDCLLLPSYGEGLPLVVQEAAASGLPVIVSEGEGYTAPLIEQQVCFAAPRTPDGMAHQLQKVLAVETPAVSTAGRRFAETHWSLSSMVSRYVQLLEELHATQPAARLRPAALQEE